MTSAAQRATAISQPSSVGSNVSPIGSVHFGADHDPDTRESLRDDALDNLESWRIAMSRSDTVRVEVLVKHAHAIREAIHLMDSSHGIRTGYRFVPEAPSSPTPAK